MFIWIYVVKNDDSDDEDGEEEEDADEIEDFEADLDIGDCLPEPKTDLLEQYRPVAPSAHASQILRPTTPAQRKYTAFLIFLLNEN